MCVWFCHFTMFMWLQWWIGGSKKGNLEWAFTLSVKGSKHHMRDRCGKFYLHLRILSDNSGDWWGVNQLSLDKNFSKAVTWISNSEERGFQMLEGTQVFGFFIFGCAKSCGYSWVALSGASYSSDMRACHHEKQALKG